MTRTRGNQYFYAQNIRAMFRSAAIARAYAHVYNLINAITCAHMLAVQIRNNGQDPHHYCSTHAALAQTSCHVFSTVNPDARSHIRLSYVHIVKVSQEMVCCHHRASPPFPSILVLNPMLLLPCTIPPHIRLASGLGKGDCLQLLHCCR